MGLRDRIVVQVGGRSYLVQLSDKNNLHYSPCVVLNGVFLGNPTLASLMQGDTGGLLVMVSGDDLYPLSARVDEIRKLVSVALQIPDPPDCRGEN